MDNNNNKISSTSERGKDMKNPKEKTLYPLVIGWGKERKIEICRIEESSGHNRRGKDGNKWLYPDLVGWEKLDQEEDDLLTDELMSKCGAPRLRFYSYEVKRSLSLGTVRQSYFQAVSNSTWANEGYLIVAEEVSKKVIEEVEMLVSMHGIGLMQFDKENSVGLEILVSAKLREVIGWGMVNRLREENSDFRRFLEDVVRATRG